MAATKSGNNIYVNDLGNTLASITSDIADATFIADLGSNVYEVKGNTTRWLEIRNEGELIISDGETLQFENPAAARTRLQIDPGGRLFMTGASLINLTTSANRPDSTYFYGNVVVSGDGTSNPIIQNPYRIFPLESQQNNSYPNDIIHIENATFGSPAAANYNFMQTGYWGKVRPHVFKNITWDRSFGNNISTGRAMYLNYASHGDEGITWEGLYFKDPGYGVYNYGVSTYMKDCVWATTTSYKAQHYGSSMVPQLHLPYYFDIYSGTSTKQQHLGAYYENPTFENSASTNGFMFSNGAVGFVSGGTFKHTTGTLFQVQYASILRLYGTQTISDPTPSYVISTAGHILNVFALDLTVNDVYGNPISGANVVAKSSGGQEEYTLETGTDGKVNNQYNIKVIYLCNNCQYALGLTNIEYWSDTSNGTYHDITVTVDGYNVHKESIVMDADKSMTVTLTKNEARYLAF